MKRFAYILLAVVILAAAVLFSGCNKTVADLTYKYNYAWIELPGGDVVEGPVQSWTDFEDGDQIQVKINDVIYLTDTTRCVMAQKGN